MNGNDKIRHIKGLVYACTAVLGGYFLVQNRQLSVSEYDVECGGLPESFDGKKILLLADLHKKRYGDNFSNLVNSVEAAAPDYIFFAGDIYSRSEKNLEPALILMHRLHRCAPVFYVAGNHEINDMERFDGFCRALEAMGIIVLRNRKAKIVCDGGSVNIYGAELPMKYYKNEDGGYRSLPKVGFKELEEMLGKADGGEFNILLCHDPFFLGAYERWGADLVFSGHCHGGIIRLPLLGGILSPERKFFPKYTKGVYGLGKTKMILTAGLGKFRLNNPSEIVVCTLRKR